MGFNKSNQPLIHGLVNIPASPMDPMLGIYMGRWDMYILM